MYGKDKELEIVGRQLILQETNSVQIMSQGIIFCLDVLACEKVWLGRLRGEGKNVV